MLKTIIKTITVTVLLTVLLPFFSFSQNKFEIDSSTVLVDGLFAPFTGMQPGDTLFLKPGVWRLLILRNLNGTENNPIVVSNENGVVEFNSNHYFGISVRHCSFLHLTGAGDKD